MEETLAGGMPFVCMDKALMNRLLMKLLDNSLKYTTLESSKEILSHLQDRYLRLEMLGRVQEVRCMICKEYLYALSAAWSRGGAWNGIGADLQRDYGGIGRQ